MRQSASASYKIQALAKVIFPSGAAIGALVSQKDCFRLRNALSSRPSKDNRMTETEAALPFVSQGITPGDEAHARRSHVLPQAIQAQTQQARRAVDNF